MAQLTVPDQLLDVVKQNTGIDLTKMGPATGSASGTGAAAQAPVAQPQEQQQDDVPGADGAQSADAATGGASEGGAAATSGSIDPDDSEAITDAQKTITDPFETAIEQTNKQLDGDLQKQSDAAAQAGGLGGRVWDALGSAGVGILAGGIHTYDAFSDLIGRPPSPSDARPDIINKVLDANAELGRRSIVNSFIGGTADFVTAMLGLGKLAEVTPVLKGITEAPKAIKWGGEVVKGMIAGGLTMDPHGGRLSDLAVQVPWLRNPLTMYLASDPSDSNAEGRLKNALEGAGMDIVMATTFSAAVKVYRFAKVVTDDTATQVVRDEAKVNLQQAQTELSKAVADAKQGNINRGGAGSLPTPGANPIADATNIGPNNRPNTPDLGGPAKLPPADNLLVGGAPAKLKPYAPSRQQIAIEQNIEGGDLAPKAAAGKAGLKGPTPVTDALVHPLDRQVTDAPKLPPAENVISGKKPMQEVVHKPNLPDADLSTPESDAEDLATEVKARAKADGQPVTVKPGSKQVFQKAVTNAGPKIVTNGIPFQMMDHGEFVATGKSLGVDNSNWLAMADRKNGTIWVSNKVLSKTPAEQSYIIMHETGHALERKFVKATTGKDGYIGELDPAIRKEMEAASKIARPKSWDSAGLMGKKTRAGRDANRYLSKPTELFADSFALWKTKPDEFRRAAPTVSKAFDQQFAAWRDFDFSQAADDIAAHSEKFAASRAPAVPGGSPKAARTTDNFISPRIPSDEEVDQFVKDSAADDAAVAQYGSKAAAEAAGHKFATANLPYQKLLGAGGLHMFMARTAQHFKAQLDEMKGGDVLHDSRVEAVVRQRAYLFNEDAGQLMGMLQQARSHANEMVANMEAAFAIANKAGDDLYQLVKEINSGNFSQYGGDQEAAYASLGPRLALYAEALGSAQSMRAAGGRAVRRGRGEFQLDPGLLNKLRTLDPEAVNRIVVMANGDRKMMAKVATRGFVDRAVRAVGTIYANNILWHWVSHVRNLTGNTFMLMSTPGMRAVGSFMLKEGGQDIRRQALREYRYMFSGMSDLFEATKSAYLTGDGAIDPHGGKFLSHSDSEGSFEGTDLQPLSGKLELLPMNTVGDFMHNTLRVTAFALGQPTRLLSVEDTFFKQMSYRAEVLAKSSLEADDKGLTGPDYQHYLQDSLDAAFDANGRGIDQEALRNAQIKTFSQPLLEGTLGKTVQSVVGQHPWLRFIVPFVKSPVNIFRYATKLTPGLNLIQTEFRQMLSGKLGPARQADAWGNMAFGSLLMVTGIGMAIGGKITGGEPTDPAQAKALAQTGWKPYSIRYDNPDGSHTYIPFNGFDPVGMTLSLIGDTTQTLQQGFNTQQDLATMLGALSLSLGQNLLNRTYFQSISNLIDGLNDPARAATSTVSSFTSGLIPFSSLDKEVDTDPYLRDAKTVQDRILANTPGFSANLPPQYDVFGNKVARTDGLWFKDLASDAANAEQQRMLTEYGIGLTPLPAQPKGGIDLRQFKLAKTGQPAFDEFARLSHQPTGFPKTLDKAIGDEVLSKRYANRPEGDREVPGTKLWDLGRIVDEYRAAAYKELLRENKDLSVATGVQQQAMRAAKRGSDLSQQSADNRSTTYVTKVLQNANAAFSGTQPSGN